MLSVTRVDGGYSDEAGENGIPNRELKVSGRVRRIRALYEGCACPLHQNEARKERDRSPSKSASAAAFSGRRGLGNPEYEFSIKKRPVCTWTTHWHHATISMLRLSSSILEFCCTCDMTRRDRIGLLWCSEYEYVSDQEGPSPNDHTFSRTKTTSESQSRSKKTFRALRGNSGCVGSHLK